jgi:hypothetical protein
MTTAQDGGKVVSLTHRPPLPTGNTPGTHFCWRLSRPQGLSANGRIMSLKNCNGTIGNRTRDLPVCSVVPQPLRAPGSLQLIIILILILLIIIIIIIIIINVSCHRPFLRGTSLEPAVIPTAQASSFTLQYFPCYVWCTKFYYYY